MEKVITTWTAHGNTSAASMPLALDAAVNDGRIKRGDTLMLEGVGGVFWVGSFLNFDRFRLAMKFALVFGFGITFAAEPSPKTRES